MAGRRVTLRARRRSNIRDVDAANELDDATIRREAEQVLVGELQDSTTTAELLQDVSDELELADAPQPGSRFRLTRARAASAGGVLLVFLAAIARRSRRRS